MTDRKSPEASPEDLTDAALDTVVGGAGGINALIAVSQLKAASAGDAASDAADTQRDLIDRQKSLRSARQAFARLAED